MFDPNDAYEALARIEALAITADEIAKMDEEPRAGYVWAKDILDIINTLRPERTPQ